MIRLHGFRFEVIPGDHDPPHTPVYRGGGRAVIYLDPIGLREQAGLKPGEVADAMVIAAEYQQRRLQAWRDVNVR